MTDLYSNIKYPYHCYEHNTPYGDDELMCPDCEREVSEENDKYYKEKEMTDKFVPSKTTYIQEESVTNFMAALGYEPVYASIGDVYGLIRFTQPRFHRTGEINISVNRAIRLHNQAGEEAFAELIAFTRPQELRDYVRDFKNYQTLITVSAGATKIVEQVKASFSRKKGFVVHDHNIKFMTRRDQKRYAHCMGF